MNYKLYSILLGILLTPTLFLAAEKNSFANESKNNDFKKKMCAGIISVPTFATFGQLLNSGFNISTSMGASLVVGGSSYFICTQITKSSDPFKNFRSMFNSK